jgi:outer membrane autotransporter protein
MHAVVRKDAAGIRYTGRTRFLAGASCAALAIACWLPAPALAADYTASNVTELRNAILAANASADPSSTITLSNSFTLPSNTTLPMPTKSITIDTQGFVLAGSTSGGNNGINFGNNVLLSAVLTVNGTFAGGNSGGLAVPGAGLNMSSSVGSTGQVINNGSITGGNALVAAKAGGVGVFVLNDATLVNNGAISGGTANAYVRPAGSVQGNGVSLSNGSTLINNVGGTVLGGNSQGIGAGAGLYMNATGRAVTATNHGTIRGGSDLTGAVAGNAAVRGLSGSASTSSLTNFGLLEGGNGAAAIGEDGSTWNLTIVNSGTIRAGAGQSNAIVFGQTAASTSALELQAGSVIEGNVIANPTGLLDVLRLGGSADASFNVSAIGPAAQYRNFDAFIKTGTSTWTLTGAATTAIPLSIEQGTLLVNGSSLGPVGVLTGARLGGTGTIGGDVTIDTNGTLAPGAAGAAPGTLRISGDLTLSSGALLDYDFGQAGAVGGTLNDLVNVTGNLTLDGTLNVTTASGGSFDPGLYRIFNYSGTLTDNGLTVGALPSPDFFLQTGVAGQINLVNTAGLTLRFWDGATDGRNNSVIGGGNGTWLANVGNDNWTNELGVPNGGFAAGSFAVFTGAAGTVTVDTSLGPVIASGMQFATNGYIVQGGDITLTGTQAVIRVGDGTTLGVFSQARIASNLVGSAQLVKSDRGTLILTGTNSYTGGTLVASGVLQVGNGGTTGSIQGDVVTNGVLAFNRSDAVTFGGTISGSGLVLQSGVGTLTLTGSNTHSGGTFIGAGTLIGSASSFGSGAITNSAALVIDQVADATLANPISGVGSFAKRGAGNLNLTGTSTFTGQTRVEAGKLSVNGSLANSSVTVLSGATLAGSGTVGSTLVRSGATIAPGNSIGTLTVNGLFLMDTGSTYEVEIAGNGASDRIAVNSVAMITGGQVGVTALDPQTSYINGQRYTILTATGGVAGNFTGVVSRSAFLDLAIEKQPNQIDLVIAVKGSNPGTSPGPGPTPPPAIFGTVAQTRNQFATAAGLDTLPQAGGTLALYNSLLMLDAPSARQAFDALSGEIHASAKSAMVDESWLLRAAVNDRLRSAFGAVGASPMATLNYGFSADLAPSATGPMPRLRSDRFAVWGQGYGSWGRSDADRNAAKLTRSTGGFLIGADVAVVDTLRLGVVAGYSRSEFDVNGRLSSGESDNYHLGLYGGGQWGALGLRLGASYTWHAIETRRTVGFAGFGDRLKAGYDAGTAQVFGELGYRVELGKLALEPFAGLAYVNLHTDGFSETGGVAALTARSDDTSLGYATLGLRASTTLALQDMDLTLRGGLAWRHAFGDVTPTAALAFTGSSAFTVAGLPIAKDAAVVEAGLDLAISKSASLGLAYTGQLAQDTQDHAFKGTLAVRF